MPLGEITTGDLFELRSKLMERVLTKEIAADTANKSMTYLNAMWVEVARAKGIKLQYDKSGTRLRSTTKPNTRPPFSDKWITERLLAPGALDGLNTDARLILLGMINTGYRPSEGAGLDENTIVLEAKTPHIIIRPEPWRALKNFHSERTIPLTGISLEAFCEAKQGFPRYRENSATLSATVNKFLEENGLLETPKHVMYSLRHSFEDRMLRAGIDERIRRDMMGHSLDRERYCDGGGIDFIATLLTQITI
ncbi:tyrosine-type recombinase/integrase [Thioclava sp. JE_KL1]|uniref:tyrosine-type recombinase/integrase n=1 Tax=Thioclava sp. JE_KL1 TaxID=2651187 RepID=UPI0020A4A3F1|nr:tyrosine-type recombinase/integrase [Thioclava sp. JE_KL1]